MAFKVLNLTPVTRDKISTFLTYSYDFGDAGVAITWAMTDTSFLQAVNLAV